MSRFTGPHPRRGAVNPPAGLVDLGKKLLGELQNRIRLGGPPTLVLRRETEEGFVEAKMEYGQPHVFITVNQGGGGDFTFTEGFATLPGASATSAASSALTQAYVFRRNGAWTAAYFDSALLQGSIEQTYQGLFPSGLMLFGNVDWRNREESACVSWFGPTDRYFGLSGQWLHAPYVFFKGRLLIDLAWPAAFAPGDAGAAEPDYPEVDGACIRGSGAEQELIVTTRSNDGSDFRLHRFTVRSVQAQKLGIDASLCADMAVVEGSGRTLLTKTDLFDGDFDLLVHPWLFNSSGTQARRIARGGDWAKELVLTRSGTNWSYSVIDRGSTARAVATSASSVVRVPFSSCTVTHTGPIRTSQYGVASAVSTIWGGTSDVGWGGTYSAGLDAFVGNRFVAAPTATPVRLVDSTSSLTETPEQLWVVSAVDFDGDTPVYAELHAPHAEESDTLVSDADTSATGASNMTLSIVKTSEVDDDAPGTTSRTVTHYQTRTWGATATVTSGYSRSTQRTLSSKVHGAGLRTSWITLGPSLVAVCSTATTSEAADASRTYVGAHVDTGVAEVAQTYTRAIPGDPWTLTFDYDTDVPPGTEPWVLPETYNTAGDPPIDSGEVDLTDAFTYNMTHASSLQESGRELFLHALDLRFKHVRYTERNWQGTGSLGLDFTLTGTLGDGAVAGDNPFRLVSRMAPLYASTTPPSWLLNATHADAWAGGAAVESGAGQNAPPRVVVERAVIVIGGVEVWSDSRERTSGAYAAAAPAGVIHETNDYSNAMASGAVSTPLGTPPYDYWTLTTTNASDALGPPRSTTGVTPLVFANQATTLRTSLRFPAGAPWRVYGTVAFLGPHWAFNFPNEIAGTHIHAISHGGHLPTITQYPASLRFDPVYAVTKTAIGKTA